MTSWLPPGAAAAGGSGPHPVVYEPYLPAMLEDFRDPWSWIDTDGDDARVTTGSVRRKERSDLLLLGFSPQDVEVSGPGLELADDEDVAEARRRRDRRKGMDEATMFYSMTLAHVRRKAAAKAAVDATKLAEARGETYPGRSELLRDLRSGKLIVDLGVRPPWGDHTPVHLSYAHYLHGERNPVWVKENRHWHHWQFNQRKETTPKEAKRRQVRSTVLQRRPRAARSTTGGKGCHAAGEARVATPVGRLPGEA